MTVAPGMLRRTFEVRSLAAALPRAVSSGSVLLCLVTAIVGYRCHEFLLNPDLRAEDGAKVFAYFYEHRELSALFRFKAGYVPFLPNVIGFLSVRVPARATPYFLTVVPTLLTICTFIVVRSSAYRIYVPRDSARFAICLALTIAPYGSFFSACHTDYSIWNALLLLMLLVIRPLPARKTRSLLLTAGMAGLVWAHPLSILALPASLTWLLRDKGGFKRALHAVLALAQLLHVWLGTRPEHALIVKRATTSSGRLLALFTRIVEQLVEGVIAPFIMGWDLRSKTSLYVASLLFMLALLLCAVLPIQRVASRSFYAWVGYGIVAPMALVLCVRADPGLASMRYHYVSRAFTSIGLCLILWQVMFSVFRRAGGQIATPTLLPTLGALIYFGFLDFRATGLEFYHQPDPDNGRIVARFFSDLAEWERKRGGYCNIRLRCKKRGADWSFSVDTRRVCNAAR